MEKEAKEITPKIVRSLYRKTLKTLREHGPKNFLSAANAAIASEMNQNMHLATRFKQERGLIIHSIGSLLIARHPRLIV